jgi:hypothetical protein
LGLVVFSMSGASEFHERNTRTVVAPSERIFSSVAAGSASSWASSWMIEIWLWSASAGLAAAS